MDITNNISIQIHTNVTHDEIHTNVTRDEMLNATKDYLWQRFPTLSVPRSENFNMISHPYKSNSWCLVFGIGERYCAQYNVLAQCAPSLN